MNEFQNNPWPTRITTWIQNLIETKINCAHTLFTEVLSTRNHFKNMFNLDININSSKIQGHTGLTQTDSQTIRTKQEIFESVLPHEISLKCFEIH